MADRDTVEHILLRFKFTADGYILNDSNHSELVVAIKAVLKGWRYISPDIFAVATRGLQRMERAGSGTPWNTLTDRERGTLKLIAEGYTNKEIAAHFHISPRTVEKHRANLMIKLNIRGKAALRKFVVEMGLLERGLVLTTSLFLMLL